MRKQLLITILLSLSIGACSSSKKSAEQKAEEAGAAVEQASKDAKDAAQTGKDKAKAALEGETTCKNGQDVRTIGVSASGEGCEVMYTKFNESTSVASGSKGSDHCSNVVSKIKENLQNAGFKCE